ncbi:hypothetical protein FA13DRAFT_1757653 [Coprinellus micaceus]|uniref:MULE transposase domain-containing protein n=1 Tax=Coprinellus micaceus TaxID=71717 RepID=A0A4Y7SGS8_COPMI|nr:hypothetical protein FA13DRAFT_1757653 [Coprinellus micaceus]
MSWENVGCLVWLKMVTTHSAIPDPENKGTKLYPFLVFDEICGIFDHSDACDAEVQMDRNPRVHLHPEVRALALKLVRENTPLPLLQKKMLEWSNQKWPNGRPGDNHFCFWLTHYDSCSLYRTVANEKGIPQRSSAEENLDLWLRKKDLKPPSPLLTESCTHYQPHVHPDTERFELVIITADMKQILLDLTFGFCTGRINLSVFMALNEQGKGEPIGKFLFSARDLAKAVHADYNTELCTHFTGFFKEALGTNEDGEKFEIYVAITDNDPCERAALAHHFLDAVLLLCTFHTAQAWHNNLVKALKGLSKDDCTEVRKWLGTMLWSLLHVVSKYDEAHQLYVDEVAYWAKQSWRRNNIAKSQACCAKKFLEYFDSYIRDKDYWFTWSPAGAIEAAQKLGVPVNQITRTNNELESWNGRLKGGCWKPHQHSGRLPRPDYWVLITITEVLPDFFSKLECD